MVATTDTRGLPQVTDFARYKEMRATMLGQSITPDGDVIRSVVTQFEDQFAYNPEENHCRIM